MWRQVGPDPLGVRWVDENGQEMVLPPGQTPPQGPPDVPSGIPQAPVVEPGLGAPESVQGIQQDQMMSDPSMIGQTPSLGVEPLAPPQIPPQFADDPSAMAALQAVPEESLGRRVSDAFLQQRSPYAGFLAGQREIQTETDRFLERRKAEVLERNDRLKEQFAQNDAEIGALEESQAAEREAANAEVQGALDEYRAAAKRYADAEIDRDRWSDDVSGAVMVARAIASGLGVGDVSAWMDGKMRRDLEIQKAEIDKKGREVGMANTAWGIARGMAQDLLAQHHLAMGLKQYRLGQNVQLLKDQFANDDIAQKLELIGIEMRQKGLDSALAAASQERSFQEQRRHNRATRALARERFDWEKEQKRLADEAKRNSGIDWTDWQFDRATGKPVFKMKPGLDDKSKRDIRIKLEGAQEADQILREIEQLRRKVGGDIGAKWWDRLKSDDRRVYDKMVGDYLFAKIKRESGAAFTDQEYQRREALLAKSGLTMRNTAGQFALERRRQKEAVESVINLYADRDQNRNPIVLRDEHGKTPYDLSMGWDPKDDLQLEGMDEAVGRAGNEHLPASERIEGVKAIARFGGVGSKPMTEEQRKKAVDDQLFSGGVGRPDDGLTDKYPDTFLSRKAAEMRVEQKDMPIGATIRGGTTLPDERKRSIEVLGDMLKTERDPKVRAVINEQLEKLMEL